MHRQGDADSKIIWGNAIITNTQVLGQCDMSVRNLRKIVSAGIIRTVTCAYDLIPSCVLKGQC